MTFPRRVGPALAVGAALWLGACAAPAPPAPVPVVAPERSTAPAAPAPGPPAPATPLAPATPSTPLPADRTVVIDPGHNGGNGAAPARIARPVPDGRGGTKPCNTTGASTDDGYPEHAFTWAVSQRLADALRQRGVRVVLTRDSDDGVGPCVDVRGRAGAAAGADAVVSVHADGGPASGSGFHVLTSSPPRNAAQGAPSRALADDTVTTLRAAGFTPADYIGTNGLDPRDDIAGLNLATVPSVLVECANLRNAPDAAAARSPAGQQRYAQALADAVLTWAAAR